MSDNVEQDSSATKFANRIAEIEEIATSRDGKGGRRRRRRRRRDSRRENALAEKPAKSDSYHETFASETSTNSNSSTTKSSNSAKDAEDSDLVQQPQQVSQFQLAHENSIATESSLIDLDVKEKRDSASADFQQEPAAYDNNNNQHSDDLIRQVSPLRQLRILSNPIAAELSLQTNPNAANPARVLFRDQQQSHQAEVNIVSVSRLLIERQIEAIQAVDGRRWNFDFRNNQPMSYSGHRYVHETSNPANPTRARSFRALINQQQTTLARISGNRQQPSSNGEKDDSQFGKLDDDQAKQGELQ